MNTLEILGGIGHTAFRSLVSATMAVGLLAGCGQKGPLYLPEQGQAQQRPSARTTVPLEITDPTSILGTLESAPVSGQ
jgi:predicted small lipoprotein YifL